MTEDYIDIRNQKLNQIKQKHEYVLEFDFFQSHTHTTKMFFENEIHLRTNTQRKNEI